MVQPVTSAKQDLSLGELLADLTKEMTTLVRQEIQLARVEMTEKVSFLGRQVALLAVGGVLAYSGLLCILVAIVILLSRAGLSLWAAALLVGVVVVGAGAMIVKKGLDAIKGTDLAPRQTLDSLKEIKHG